MGTKKEDKISSCIQDFISNLVGIENKSPLTAKEYLYDIKRFLSYMMKKNNIICDDYTFADDNFFNGVTKADIINFIHHLASENVKVVARARKLSALKTLIKYLHDENKISSNVAEDIRHPKINKRIPQYLTLDESIKLLKSTEENEDNEERNLCILTLFLHTGIRLSELIAIDLDDIKDNSIIIKGKGNKQRMVPINKACIKALDEYIIVRNQLVLKKEKVMKSEDKKALFLSKRACRISRRTVQYIVENCLMQCDLDNKKYSTHKLRHTAATLLHKYGKVDIMTLKELLGHISVSSSEIYTHVENDEITDAVGKNPLCNI